MSVAQTSASALDRPMMRGWLHVAGVVMVVGCSPLLFSRCVTWAQVIWVLCYVIGVASMMGTSALFHRVRWSQSRRRAWRRADHSAIFFAISGSYLALAGLTMHGTIRLVLMLVIGSSALVGIAIRQLTLDTPKWVNTLPYLVVGWSAVAFLPQIGRGGGATVLTLVIIGGLVYSLGAVVYGAKRPRLSPRIFGYHELFHALTLVGAGLHFAAIYIALR